MGHIFISYSRRDSEFVYRLREALIEAGQKTWLDKEKIPPSDLWLSRIKSAIDEAEAVIFVLSPASLASEVCGKELDYAFSRNKRVIPVVWRDPQGEVRDDVAEINYVFLRESDDFATGLADLIEAVETDLDWVRAHTRLLVRAVEWDRLGREVSYTLRGRDLGDFEDWAARGQDMKPRPTALQTEYLLASRRAVTRRQRILWSAGALALMVAAILGTVAWFQNAERARQAEIVAARALLSRSEAARDIPTDDRDATASHARALLLATQALDRLVRVRAATADADLAVRKSYMNLEKWRTPERLTRPILGGWGFGPSGRYLARYFDGDIVVRDLPVGIDGPACRREPVHGESDVGVAVDADGDRVALVFGTRGEDKELNAVEAWDVSVRGCARILREPVPGGAQVDLSRDGRLLAAAMSRRLRIWDLESGESRDVPASQGLVREAAFSPDGTALVIYSRSRGARTTTLHTVDVTTGEVGNTWSSEEYVRTLDWVPGGIFVQKWDTGTLFTPDLQPIHDIPLPERELAAVSEDGRLAGEATRNGRIRVVSLRTGESLASAIWTDTYQISRLAFGPDGQSLTVAEDSFRRLANWHFLDRGAFALLEASGPAAGLQFRDGRLEAWAGDESATWALPEDGPPQLMSDTLAGFSPRASGRARGGATAGSELSVASARSGREAALIAGEMTRAGPTRRLVVRENGAESLGRDYEPVLDADQSAFLTWAGNDRYLVIGTRDGLEIVDAATLDPVATVYHANTVRAGVAADGRSAATLDRRGRIKVWDVGEGTQRLEIETRAEISTLALSDDGRWLAGLSPGGRVRLWALAPADLIEQACRWLDPPCP